VAVSDAYLAGTMTSREAIVGRRDLRRLPGTHAELAALVDA
jgi:hypothetical protein